MTTWSIENKWELRYPSYPDNLSWDNHICLISQTQPLSSNMTEIISHSCYERGSCKVMISSFICSNGAPVWHVDTIQELADIFVAHTTDTLDGGRWDEYEHLGINGRERPAHLIGKPCQYRYPRESVHPSVLLTPKLQLLIACLHVVRSAPIIVNVRYRKYIELTFSPKKLRISTEWPSSWMMQLIGKWAYTARILYWNP